MRSNGTRPRPADRNVMPPAGRAGAVHRLGLYHDMLRIRRFEEACAEMYSSRRVHGPLHLCVGEEACVVGAMQALRTEDAVVATYREHAHALMRGVSMERAVAEMLGVVEGCCRGRGGSMHLFDRRLRFYGGGAIGGAGLPIAVGVALAARMRGGPGVTACFFGDGAAAEGAFHESLSLAALWRLPILFVCENHGYAMGGGAERAPTEPRIAESSRRHRIHTETVDGTDVEAVETAAVEAAERVRTDGKPAFLELLTRRFRAHPVYDPERDRSKEEVQKVRRRDPLRVYGDRLRQAGLLDDDAMDEIDGAVSDEVAAAVAFAEAGTPEPVEDLARFVYAEARSG